MGKFIFLRCLIGNFIFAVAISTAPALATPPRYVSVSDTAIGISATHIFVLRIFSDNEGSHFVNNMHRFLVAQNIKTGRADQHWLLDITRLEYDLDANVDNVVSRQVVTETSLIAILANQHAVPAMVSSQSTWRENGPALSNQFRLTAEGLFSVQENSTKMLATPELIQSRISATMDPVLRAMPDDPTPVDPITFDSGAYSRSLVDCFVQGLWMAAPGFSAFRLDCENDGFSILKYSIFLLIPEED